MVCFFRVLCVPLESGLSFIHTSPFTARKKHWSLEQALVWLSTCNTSIVSPSPSTQAQSKWLCVTLITPGCSLLAHTNPCLPSSAGARTPLLGERVGNLDIALSPSSSSSPICPCYPSVSKGEQGSGWPGNKGVRAFPVSWRHSRCPCSRSPLHLLRSPLRPSPSLWPQLQPAGEQQHLGVEAGEVNYCSPAPHAPHKMYLTVRRGDR